MQEITYLPEVDCTVGAGFLPHEVAVAVQGENNRLHLRVPKGLVSKVGDKHYLAVGIVQLDYRGRRALVELPHEADSGVRRLWVPFASFRPEEKTT